MPAGLARDPQRRLALLVERHLGPEPTAEILLEPIELRVDVSREGLRWAREVDQAAHLEKLASPTLNVTGDEGLKVWNRVTSCLLVAAGDVTAKELAALLGDRDMVAHLISGGAKLPERPLVCARRTVQGRGFARVVFDPVSARVLTVDAS